MEYTLTTAAKATGIGRSTIHRAITKGRLSAKRLEDGSYRIDPAELARAFPPSQPIPEGPSPWDAKGQPETPRDGGGTELALLRLKVSTLEDMLSRERETVDDLRKRLDREAEERRVLLRQLMPPATEKPQEHPSPSVSSSGYTERPRGLLARLLGR